ncbi:MAG: XdhC family protein [Candidatus Krumholzibacteriia bacterium]
MSKVIGGGGETVFPRLAAMVDQGEDGVLATVIRTRRSTPREAGSKMIVHVDGSVTGSIGGGAAEAKVIEAAGEVLATGVCRMLDLDLAGGLGVCGGVMEVFLEPVLQSSPFWVIGAGHVGRALVELGRTLPFRFTLVDDRPEFLQDLRPRPDLQILQADPKAFAELVRVNPRGALLVASRSHELDGDYWAAVLEAERRSGQTFGFLGGLGSDAKAAVLRRRFAGDAAASLRLEGAQLPVGLDIGAETPAEIALSVLAEASAVLRGRPLLLDDQGRPLGVRLHRRRKG